MRRVLHERKDRQTNATYSKSWESFQQHKRRRWLHFVLNSADVWALMQRSTQMNCIRGELAHKFRSHYKITVDVLYGIRKFLWLRSRIAFPMRAVKLHFMYRRQAERTADPDRYATGAPNDHDPIQLIYFSWFQPHGRSSFFSPANPCRRARAKRPEEWNN